MAFRGENFGGVHRKDLRRRGEEQEPQDSIKKERRRERRGGKAIDVMETTPEYGGAYFTIPKEILERINTLEGGGWVYTPPPIIQGLKAAGFAVHVIEKGNEKKRGDKLKIFPPDGGEAQIYTTDEALVFLKKIVSNQYALKALHFLEKEAAAATSAPEIALLDKDIPTPSEEMSETPTEPVVEVEAQESVSSNEVVDSEAVNTDEEDIPVLTDVVEDADDGIPTLTDVVSEEELTTTTPPSTIEGEVVHNNTPVKNFELGDAGIEDAVILRETAKPNIGKERERGDVVIAQRNEVVAQSQKKEQEPALKQEGFFDARFASEFGVTKEIWEQIPGSEKLSVAQQKLVFENLREFNERDKTPYLSHVWEGAMKVIGYKKDMSPTLAALTQLVESAALYGPKVHEENGELLTDFVGLDIPRESRKEWKQAFDALNASAHRMSKTPASWQEDGIGTHSERESKMMSFVKNTFSPARKRYKEYQEIQASYDAQKKELSRILGEAKYEPGVIAAKLVDIDKNVHMLQFQQTSPDAVEVIKDIPDAGMWRKTGRFLCNHKDKLGYMGLGFLGRTALAGATGILAAPLTSAAIAGGRAWDKSAAEMRERDRAARMGTRDTSKEALNIVSAEMTIDIAGEKREVGATQKLQYLIDKYQSLSKTHDIEGPPSPEYVKKMNTLLESIRVRASYVEDKQRLNRINYGNKEERPVQMAKLYETLALAQMIAADNSDFPKIDEPIPDWRKDKNPKTLEERLASELSKTENSIQNKRRSRQVKEASRSALTAGAFAYAGGLLAREAQEMGLGEKLARLVHDSPADRYVLPAELSPFDQPLLTSEEIARAQGAAANFPYAEEAPMAAQHAPYTIKSGDTLTKILKEQMPEIQALDAGRAQNTAVTNILRGLSAEELQSVGIRSGNPDLIYAGDTINTDALHKIIESQSLMGEGALRAGGAAHVVQEGVGGKAPEALYTPKPLDSAPQSIETLKVVSVDAEGFGAPSKYAYIPGVPNPGEDSNLRTMVLNEATQNTERWMKMYPRAGAVDAIKAGVMEGHFKNLFKEQWSIIGEARVTDILSRGLRFPTENSERTLFEFKTLVETMEKPPMNVAPMPAENIKDYLERASMAYALKGEAIPEGNLLHTIEMYYQSPRR